MLMSVAFWMDQRKVADWPFAIVLGSAVKLEMVGFGCVGAAAGAGAGGGGGGGGGTFFLQPAAKMERSNASTMALSFQYCDLLLFIISRSFSSV
jgi:hypothetical protein